MPHPARNRLDFPVRQPQRLYLRTRALHNRARITNIHIAENDMSKGMDSKKNEKKKPSKTLKEKRAAKQEKKKGQ